MVKRKKVLVMILVVMMVVATISAGAVARGGFGGYGAAAVVEADETGDVVRPIQRWQTLTDEELANCPLCGEDVDIEAIRAFQAERAELRETAQAEFGYGSAKGNGRMMRNTETDYGRNVPATQNRRGGNSSMMDRQRSAQTNNGPVWAR